VLVDTSVWINHFRRSDAGLERLLDEGRVSIHPFVIGELACGSLKRRGEVIDLLSALPVVTTATHEEALQFVDDQPLYGTGLGWIDVHLLASARLSNESLWSADARLRRAAIRLGLAE
jgi:predicted nucleic acid-binding protein